MSLFDEAQQNLNAAAIAIIGRGVTVRVGQMETQLTGVVSLPHKGIQIGPAAVRDVEPSVSFNTVDWLATCAEVGSVIIDGLTEYTVIDIEPDDGGMTKITMRAY